MKKIVAIVAFSLLLGNMMNAQNDFRFGMQVSPTFTWMNTNVNHINSNGTNLGLKLGVLGEYYFQENYAFFAGLGFGFNQGGTLKYDYAGIYWPESESGFATDTLNGGLELGYGMQYIEIPFGLKMRTKEFGYLRYFAEIPVFTIGIATQSRGTMTGEGVAVEKLDIKKEVGLLNLSWGLGGGVEFSVSESTSIVGGIYYQSGFSDITSDKSQEIDPNKGLEEEDSKATLGGIVIRIGVMF